MTNDDMHRKIAYQVMAQPKEQDVTVTFGDGTTITARYIGSISAVDPPTTDRTARNVSFSLSFLADVGAEIGTPKRIVCDAIRTDDQWHISYPRASADLKPAHFPCLRPAGHPDGHLDEDGDMWYEGEDR